VEASLLTNRENERLHDVKMAPEMYASGENAASFHRVHGGLTVNQSKGDISPTDQPVYVDQDCRAATQALYSGQLRTSSATLQM
jgi:hypothetical protein